MSLTPQDETEKYVLVHAMRPFYLVSKSLLKEIVDELCMNDGIHPHGLVDLLIAYPPIIRIQSKKADIVILLPHESVLRTSNGVLMKCHLIIYFLLVFEARFLTC